MAVASCKWQPISIKGRGPSPRQGHSCTSYKNGIYLFGGSTIQQDGQVILYYNDLYKLDVSLGTVTWSLVTQNGHVPQERDGANQCCVGSCLYLHGGKNQLYAEECLPNVYQYNIENGDWSLVNTDKLRSPQSLSHSLTQVESSLYAFGGIEKGEATNKTFCFNTTSQQWTPLQTSGCVPKARCDHAATSVDHRIYIFGGCAGKKRWLDDLYCLDTRTLKWTEIRVSGSPPQTRAMHTLVAHRGKDIYVFGGECGGKTLLNDVMKYSLGPEKWKHAMYSGVSPSARLGHVAVILHSTMYVIGGLDKHGELNDVHALKLINPVDRQPVLKELMQENGVPSRSLEYQATAIPTMSYHLHTPPYSTPQLSNSQPRTTERRVRDFSEIRTKASKGIEAGIRALEEEYYKLDIACSDLHQDKQELKQREEAYSQMYYKQQRELELSIAEHQAVTESWLKSRQQENDVDRKVIAEQRCILAKQQEEVRAAQHSLAEREEHIYNILKQFDHI